MSNTHENEVNITDRLSCAAPRGCTRATAEQLHLGAYTQVAQDGLGSGHQWEIMLAPIENQTFNVLTDLLPSSGAKSTTQVE